jgi:hypothetical protein
MSIITAADITFDGEQIKSLGEAVFESAFAKPEIAKFHKIVTGIVAKKQIVIMGRISGLVGKGSGECDPTDGPNTIGMSEKFWTPEMISDRLSQCWVDLKETFFVWGLKKGVEKSDLTSTDFLNFVEELMVDVIYEAIYRFAWFGDTDAADVDATPAGVLTSGTNAAYFNKINGFWKQAFGIVGASAARLTAGITAKNGAASYALQAFNSTDTTNRVVTNTLQNMKFGADRRLRGDETKVYIATQSVADQYERELIATTTAYEIDKIENGISLLKSGSIEVYVFEFWDRIIEEFYDNGTTYHLPHRIVLVSPENLQVGCEDEGSLISMDTFYDKKTKKNYIDFAFSLDAKIIKNAEIQLAY